MPELKGDLRDYIVQHPSVTDENLMGHSLNSLSNANNRERTISSLPKVQAYAFPKDYTSSINSTLG